MEGHKTIREFSRASRRDRPATSAIVGDGPTLNSLGRPNRLAEVDPYVARISRIDPHFYRRSRLQCARLDRPDRLLDLNVVRRTTGDLHPERDLDQLPPPTMTIGPPVPAKST